MSCSVVRSSSESVSESCRWRRVPEWCGVDPAAPGAGDEWSGVGSLAGAWSVECP